MLIELGLIVKGKECRGWGFQTGMWQEGRWCLALILYRDVLPEIGGHEPHQMPGVGGSDHNRMPHSHK